MAMRQYIGARYVPKFLGTYDPTQQYEALDVVDNGSGTSYIARDNVPAGTPLTDTTHWFIYGASSGAIVSLQNRMDAAENDIDDLENIVNDLFDIAVRDKRKMLLIADSYGDNPRATLFWTTQIQSIYTDARAKAHGGYGFMTFSIPSPDYCFLGLLKEFKSELTDAECAEITDIVVCGGWNDAWQVTQNGKSASDVLQPIRDFVDYANTNFPNAIPHIGFIGWQSNDVTQADPTTEADLNLIQDMYEKTRYKNLHVLAGVSSIMKNTRYLDNSYSHPNNSGGAALGLGILTAMFGGFNFAYNHSISNTDVDWNTNNSSSGTIDGKITSYGDTVTLDLYISNINSDTNSDSCLFTFKETALNWGHNNTYKMSAYNFTKKHGAYCSIGADRKFRVYNPGGETSMTNEVIIVNITLNARYY